MIYLDTSTCVGLLRGDIKVNPAVWRNYSPKEFGIPVIVESELIIAAAQSGHPEENISAVRQFLLPFPKVPYDSKCCELHCYVRLWLEASGTPTGTNTLVLAAMSLRYDATLLTRVPNVFRRIPEMKVVECGDDFATSLALCQRRRVMSRRIAMTSHFEDSCGYVRATYRTPSLWSIPQR